MANCPICKKKKVQQDFRPFCSKRCSDIDLAKWLNDSYVIASDSPDEESEDELIRDPEQNEQFEVKE